MSRNIDNRIVDMQFNNQRFERNVQQSVSSLDRLKRALNLSSSAKSLEQLDKTAGRFSLAAMSKGVDLLTSKFSALGIMGITTIQNLTNRVIDSGIRMAKSLTLDPITTGLDEYETKMNAIQTLLTNTKDKGTTLSDVNASLAELNEYADKTIYNFAQMTENASKFAAAGLDLESSTEVVKGLSNVAAGYGVDAERMAGATYQMTQALSAGSVKLMDWNSLQNAGMGGQSLQREMVMMAESMGIVIDKSKPFRETLEQGWLTSEVFTKVMSKMAKDPALLEAATNVTTFTKLVDTMREAVQSGWASTWENIIGDKDQSTKLFTEISNGFSDIVGASAKARNEMLKFWNENGGRDAILNALGNAFLFLGKVIEPIKQAFTDIFPPLTGERLVEMSKWISNLTENLKVSEGTTNNLRRTFSGLFAVVDILFTVFKQAVGIISSFWGVLLPVNWTILTITGSIGEFLVALKNIIKTLGLFTSKGQEAIVSLFRDTFNSKLDYIIQSVSGTLEKMKNSMGKLGVAAGYVKGLFDGLVEVFKGLRGVGEAVTTMLFNFVGGIYLAIGGIRDYINQAKGVTKTNTKVATSFQNTGATVENNTSTFSRVWTAVVDGLKKTWSLLDPFKASFVNAFNFIKDGLKNNMKDLTFDDILGAIQTGFIASFFMTVRKFIKIINKGLPDLLEGATATLDGVRKSLGAWQNNLRSKTIINLAIGVAILAGAILVLSRIDSDKLVIALGAVAALFLEVTAAMALMAWALNGKVFATMFQMAIAMTALSVSVILLASAMKKLAGLNWKEVATGLITIAGLMFVLTAASKSLTTNSKGLISASLAMLGLAGSVVALSSSIERLSKLKWEEIKMGLGVILTILTSVMILSAVVDGTDLLTTAAGITLLAGALYIMSGAIGILGNMNIETLKQGLMVSAIALGMLSVAMKLMPANLLGTAVGVVVLASSLYVMAGAIAIFANMQLEVVAKGLGLIAVTLTVLVMAMRGLAGVIFSAGALIIIAGALILLTIPIKILAALPFWAVIGSLVALAGAMLILGGSAVMLAVIAPVLSSVGLSLVLLGAGVALAGLGLIAFNIALAGFIAIGYGIVSFIPVLGKAFRTLVEEIKKTLPGIKLLFRVLIRELIDLVPDVVALIRILLDAIIDLIVAYTPILTKAIIDMIIGLADAIRDQEKEVRDAGEYILKVLVQVLWDAAYDAMYGLYNLGGEMIYGILNGITGQKKEFKKAGREIGEAAKEGTEESLEINSPSKVYWQIGTNAGQSFSEALKAASPDAANNAFLMGAITGESLQKGFNSKSGGSLEIPFQNPNYKAPKKADNLLESWGLKLKSIIGYKKEAEKVTKNLVDPLAAFGKGGDDKKKTGSKGRSSDVKTAKELAEEKLKMEEEARKADYQKSVDWIDEKKYYNQLSLQEELDAWGRVQLRFAKGTEERKNADREVYRVKNELLTKQSDIEKKIEAKSQEIRDIRYQRNMNQSAKTLAEEEVRLRTVRDKTNINYQQEREINKKLVDITKQRNELAKNVELEIKDIRQEAHEKRLELEDDYYEKQKEITEKVTKDIEEVGKKYTEALTNRTNALYTAYGLFTKVESKNDMTKGDIIENLKTQVNALSDYRMGIERLTKRGVDTGLVDELEALGPGSLEQIKLMNDMSDDELRYTVELWRRKGKEARLGALSELEGMKADSLKEIEKLTTDSDLALKALKTTYDTNVDALALSTAGKIAAVKKNWIDEVGALATETEIRVGVMATNVENELKKPDWDATGKYVMDGVKIGMESKAQDLANTAASIMLRTLQAAKDAIAVQSPSKKFAEVGKFSILGLAIGMKDYASVAFSTVTDIGTVAVRKLGETITKIGEFVNDNMDTTPVIRPVLDLSDVKSGNVTLSSMLSKTKGINVASVNANLPSINTQSEVNEKGQNGSGSISFTQINNSPKALSRIEIYRQTKNQLSAVKGMV